MHANSRAEGWGPALPLGELPKAGRWVVGMNRPNQGRAAGEPTIIKAISRPGIFERRGRVCGNAGVIRSVMHQPAQRERERMK